MLHIDLILHCRCNIRVQEVLIDRLPWLSPDVIPAIVDIKMIVLVEKFGIRTSDTFIDIRLVGVSQRIFFGELEGSYRTLGFIPYCAILFCKWFDIRIKEIDEHSIC